MLNTKAIVFYLFPFLIKAIHFSNGIAIPRTNVTLVTIYIYPPPPTHTHKNTYTERETEREHKEQVISQQHEDATKIQNYKLNKTTHQFSWASTTKYCIPVSLILFVSVSWRRPIIQ
jgi:hypothetical protein